MLIFIISVAIGCFLGWFTNVIAVRMVLFEVRIFGWKLPGSGLIRKYKKEIKEYVLKHYDNTVWPSMEKALDDLWIGVERVPVLAAGLLLGSRTLIKSGIRSKIRDHINRTLEKMNFEDMAYVFYKASEKAIRYIEVYGALLGSIMAIIFTI